ncbi:hypothetical protein C5167_009047 [Papaver somniferum]|uniref:RNase H type-1 domain-containing protein n=1 Tax=Papaver somniferum TaxID=3469 RepID=A0A4Y7JXC7_PAPSO|nr:hypothetical protein C5167_009047 [Papaver somniferum]
MCVIFNEVLGADHLESLAVFEGMQWALQLGLKNIIIKLDYQSLIPAIQRVASDIPWDLRGIVEDIILIIALQKGKPKVKDQEKEAKDQVKEAKDQVKEAKDQEKESKGD